MPGAITRNIVQRGKLRNELLQHVFVRGLGAPLIFVWAAGLGLFCIIWWQPLLAVAWTAVALAIAAAMATSYSRSRDVSRASLRLVLERRLQVKRLRDARQRSQVQQSLELVVEIALRASDIEQAGGEDPNLERLLCSAHDLLVLHCQAAGEAELAQKRECPAAPRILKELRSAERSLAALQARGFRGEPGHTASLAGDLEEAVAAIRADPRIAPDLVTAPSADGEAAGDGGPGFRGADLPREFQGVRAELRAGFSRIDLAAGLQALDLLDGQYARLLAVLERRRDADPLAVAQIPLLAEETYRQGLSVLEDALDLAGSIHSSERRRLEQEVVELEREVAALKESELDERRLTMKQERAASHRERLEIIERHGLRVEELLHQCQRCEACLDRTRMELASIKADFNADGVTAVTETLRKTIEQARGVRDELKRLGL